MCTVLIIVMRAPPSFQSCCVKIIKSLDVIVAHHSSKVEILPLEASNHTYIMYVHCVYTHSSVQYHQNFIGLQTILPEKVPVYKLSYHSTYVP